MKLLVKAYTATNLGDDLFLKILFERYPNAKFLLEEDKNTLSFRNKYSNTINLKIPILYKIIYKILNSFKIEHFFLLFLIKRIHYNKLAKRTDGLIFIGGSIFMQNKTKIQQQDLINKIIIECFRKKPKFIIGANFGPFIEDDFLEFYNNIFKQFDDVCFRDKYSKHLFNSLPNVRDCPDIVFQLPINYKIHKGRIGFSIIDLSIRENLKIYEMGYLLKLAELIKMYIYDGFDIYLFSFCEFEGDEIAIKNLMKLLPINYQIVIHVIRYDGDINKFLDIYLTIEKAYTTRFHAMILSLISKQEICPLIYSDKMLHVIKDISTDINYYRINEFIHEDAATIMSNVKYYDIQLNTLATEAKKQFEKLDIMLLKGLL